MRGGLRVKDLESFNAALLAKWRWNLFRQSNSLWAKIIVQKIWQLSGIESGK